MFRRLFSAAAVLSFLAFMATAAAVQWRDWNWASAQRWRVTQRLGSAWQVRLDRQGVVLYYTPAEYRRARAAYDAAFARFRAATEARRAADAVVFRAESAAQAARFGVRRLGHEGPEAEAAAVASANAAAAAAAEQQAMVALNAASAPVRAAPSGGWGARYPTLLAGSAVLPVLWVVGQVVGATLAARRRLAMVGLCPACGYDLRATPERCPECGRGTAV